MQVVWASERMFTGFHSVMIPGTGASWGCITEQLAFPVSGVDIFWDGHVSGKQTS